MLSRLHLREMFEHLDIVYYDGVQPTIGVVMVMVHQERPEAVHILDLWRKTYKYGKSSEVRSHEAWRIHNTPKK